LHRTVVDTLEDGGPFHIQTIYDLAIRPSDPSLTNRTIVSGHG